MNQASAKYCDQCGFEITANAKFCGGCGRKLSDTTTERVNVRESVNQPRTTKTIEWLTSDEDTKLQNFPYAQSGSDALFTGAVMLGAMMGGKPTAPGEAQPPLATTWLMSRDKDITGRCTRELLSEVAKIFGDFVLSRGLLDGPWDALEIQTPLGNSGLVMLANAHGAEAATLRIMVPLAYAVQPEEHEKEQVQATMDWVLRKLESPYIAYVPLIDDASQREGLIETLIARSGTPHPGPLSDLTWLSDPSISAVGSNSFGFPGAGSLRIGVLDEQQQSRERALFRSGKLELIELPPGTVDLYAGWQIEPSGMGMVGLMALGHRSLMGGIDAMAEIPALANELGGVAPNA